MVYAGCLSLGIGSLVAEIVGRGGVGALVFDEAEGIVYQIAHREGRVSRGMRDAYVRRFSRGGARAASKETP